MIRFSNKLFLTAFLAGAILFGAGPLAHAGYVEIDYAIDGGPRTVAASSSTGIAIWSNASVGGLFNVYFTFGTTNSPGGTQALLTQSNNLVSTLYTGPGVSHTLQIYVSSTGFVTPSPLSPALAALGNASSITENGGATTVTFTSYADTSNNGNTLFGMSGPSTAVTYSVSGQAGNGGQSSTTFAPNGAAYSLTSVGDFTMTGGTSLTVVSGNTTVTHLPVPPGLVLALTGVPFLAVG
jgi:hypothetical protein